MLLVEDNPADAELFREHVEDVTDLDVDVEHVALLGEAIARLGPGVGSPIDAVLLDLGLPDSSGLDGVARLRRSRPEIPLVVLTGNRDVSLGVRAVQSGAQDFLDKNDLDGPAIARSLQFAIARFRLESQVRVILARNLDAMLVVGRDSKIRYVNRAAEDLFGRRADLLVGTAFPYDLDVPGDTRDVVVEDSGRGEVRVGHMRVAHIEWSGEPAFLASIRDITELRHAQELERRLMHANRLASIGQLAAGVAHEVNNPATFMLANLSVLGEELSRLEAGVPLDASTLASMRELIGETEAGMTRIVKVVRDLSTFSRIGQDDIERVGLEEVAATALSMGENEIRHRATLVRHLEPVPRVAADRAKLTQVVLNLLINAVHAVGESPREEHTITVSTWQDEQGVHLAVRDSGGGIDEETRAQLFEPFFTTKARDVGTGLGLAICAEVIASHRGRIEVESEVGVGSCFEVVLPMDTGLEVTLSRDTPEAIAMAGALRVLVIDDEPLLCRAVARLLGGEHDVETTTDAGEALTRLEAGQRYDLVLCDVMMPALDGPAFHREVRARFPALLERVVFMTGGAFTDETRGFLERGDVRFVEKPITRSELGQILELARRAQA